MSNKLAVCLFVRDEERDIAEWLAYQLATGFDTVLVYDNGSVDRTPEIVRAFGRQFDVRLIDWPDETEASQTRCYVNCFAKFGAEFNWIAMIDSDELITFRDGDVRSLLAGLEGAAAVALNWACFGSSGHKTRPPGLMMETFKRRAKSDFSLNRIVKFVRRPSSVSRRFGTSDFVLPNPTVTPSGRLVQRLGNGMIDRVEHSVAQVSHYFTRSRDDWDRKLARGYRGRDDRGMRGLPFEKLDRNELLDLKALRFAPAVHAILQERGFEQQRAA